MGLRSRLVSWDLNSRQCLRYGQQHRNIILLVRGAGAAQDVCATLFKSPWRPYPWTSTLLSSDRGRSSGRIRCSSSSIWRKSSPNTSTLGKVEEIEELWEEYFADPSQWWDNRVDKRNPKSPDFKHKVTRKALWIDGWSTPTWVRTRLTSLGPGKFHSHYAGGKHVQSASTASDALTMMKNLLQQDIIIDSFMYAGVLKQCRKQEDLTAVGLAHDSIMKTGMGQNVYVANNLMSAYIRCGRVRDARQVFDELVKKNVFSWTIMVGGYAQHKCASDAVEVFRQMCQAGVQPDGVTYLSILKAFDHPGALKWGKEVHACIEHDGFESDVRVANALVHMYARSGSIDDAKLVFNRVENRDVVTWNVMIGGLAEHGCVQEAYELYASMRREGCVPNAVTYVNVMNACEGSLEWVRDVHRHIVEAGMEMNVWVCNALVHKYAKSGSIDDAKLVFDRMKDRDIVTWNVIIGGLAEHGRVQEAYELYASMRREGCVPDAVTYVNVLTACEGTLEWVRDVHRHIVEAGMEMNVWVCNALVHKYAKSGSIDDAQQVFDRMEDRNVVTWNVMIGGLAEHGRVQEAYELYASMRREGCVPDAVTYVNVLTACEGALEWVRDVHRHIVEAGMEMNVWVCNVLVHMYAKSGSMNDAQLVFDAMVDRDAITWNAMIGALGQHGQGQDALVLFRRMIADGTKPDEWSFVSILSACSHAGLVDEGRELFSVMLRDYGVEPTALHYTCMVDLLGRAGLLEEAKLFICDMPGEVGATTWGALLGACRIYGDVELGELAGKEVLKLDPEDASPYVLLSNIYAAAGQWDQVSLIRCIMQERGIRKEPGVSWIEVDKNMHRFCVEDKSHLESKEIYAVLDKLIKLSEAAGYVPDTRLVLRDIDEEAKRNAICLHSEKLAIAYGMMHTAPGKPIHVYKNLRVCSDCHTATKFISKVTGREIVARDANRFHHFKDGVCSCRDYW